MSDVTAFYISVVTIDVVECTLCTETINVSLDSQRTYYTERRRRQTLLDANKLATVLKISVQTHLGIVIAYLTVLLLSSHAFCRISSPVKLRIVTFKATLCYPFLPWKYFSCHLLTCRHCQKRPDREEEIRGPDSCVLMTGCRAGDRSYIAVYQASWEGFVHGRGAILTGTSQLIMKMTILR